MRALLEGKTCLMLLLADEDAKSRPPEEISERHETGNGNEFSEPQQIKCSSVLSFALVCSCVCASNVDSCGFTTSKNTKVTQILGGLFVR